MAAIGVLALLSGQRAAIVPEAFWKRGEEGGRGEKVLYYIGRVTAGYRMGGSLPINVEIVTNALCQGSKGCILGGRQVIGQRTGTR